VEFETVLTDCFWCGTAWEQGAYDRCPYCAATKEQGVMTYETKETTDGCTADGCRIY
jgi:rubrerythrin